MSRTVCCPKCGSPSSDGTIYLTVPVIECAPVIGIADSVVQVEGPMTRRPVPDSARLECGRMNDDGSFCAHTFTVPTGLGALIWNTNRG